MKTVVITGSNGLLGQKLTNLLTKRNACRVIATGLGANRNPTPNSCEYVNLDVTSFEDLKALFHKYRPTEVINTAAMTNVDACELNPDACQALNVTAVRYLCGLCLEYESRLIHLSTDFIFDGKNGPYKEEDQPNPLSIYGQSKLDAENLIVDSGVKNALIRTILLYGVVPNMSRSNIVLWIKDSLTNKQTIKLVEDQIRTPTLAEDLADGIASVVFKDKTGIYHLSGSELMSIYQLGQRVADFWQLDSSLIEPVTTDSLTQPAKRPPKTGFIILKAQTDLGYKPNPLERGLEIVDRQLKALQS